MRVGLFITSCLLVRFLMELGFQVPATTVLQHWAAVACLVIYFVLPYTCRVGLLRFELVQFRLQ